MIKREKERERNIHTDRERERGLLINREREREINKKENGII